MNIKRQRSNQKNEKLHNFYTPDIREKNSGVFFSIAERGELIKVIYIL